MTPLALNRLSLGPSPVSTSTSRVRPRIFFAAAGLGCRSPTWGSPISSTKAAVCSPVSRSVVTIASARWTTVAG